MDKRRSVETRVTNLRVFIAAGVVLFTAWNAEANVRRLLERQHLDGWATLLVAVLVLTNAWLIEKTVVPLVKELLRQQRLASRKGRAQARNQRRNLQKADENQ